MLPKQFEELVTNNPVIFYVGKSNQFGADPVEGVFLMASEAIWLDNSGLFDKYSESLVSVSPIASSALCRSSLQPVYPDKEKFFCEFLHVQRRPSIEEFFHLLLHISSTCTVPKALSDILAIFTIIGRKLSNDDGEVQSVVKKYQEQFKNENVIPTKRGVWADLSSKPMLADDKKLEKLFSENPEVFFVDVGEKIGVSASRKLTNKGEHVHKRCQFLKK
jgi:hypothetical protein